MKNVIVRSNCIVTCNESSEILDGFIHVIDGIIAEVGKGDAPVRCFNRETRYVDTRGKTVTPGLIDAHTHLVHGGSRENELALKLKGTPYLEILKKGGGILSTVESTRKSTKEELKTKARKSLDQMLIHGTTTIEAKSGYGLDFETEVKCLKTALELNEEHPVDIINTYLGAHAIPKEYKDNIENYMTFMTDEVMPYVSENHLAEFMDVFCEEGIFSPQQSRILMEAGKTFGLKLKIHADEIVPLKGAELASEMQAVSADHLLAVSEEGIEAMSKAGVTAVLLPGTSFYLMLGKYANARKMMNRGVRVAIATDYNPGSCPTENMQEIMTYACFGMKLLPEEIIRCMTINAAYAIDRSKEIGSIECGKKADMVVFNAPNLEYIFYHFGINHVDKVIKDGKLVVENGRLIEGVRI